jgi:hypothetical protein
MPGTILMIVASTLAGAAGTPPKPLPLPPLNARVEAFARSNLGKTVGDGICITLAVEALEAAGARRASFRDPNGDFTWGDPVPDFKDVLPGDILQFRDAVFRGKRSVGRSSWKSWHQEYPHHTAIVAKVEPGGKILTILHQNITTEGPRPGNGAANGLAPAGRVGQGLSPDPARPHEGPQTVRPG